jgi:hypothetical protein
MSDNSQDNQTTRRHSMAMYVLIAAGLTVWSGCSFSGGPKARMGYLPTATFNILFSDPNRLGKHTYRAGPSSEVGGIVYTCRGGHIDLDHVRGNADNVRYLTRRIRETLSNGKEGFSFNLTGEMSTHVIGFTYPADWDELPDKDLIIEKIAFDTAPYLSFNATIFHEIQTWFGVHYAFIEPEFNSAFSWEDIYSNLIGVRLGAEAMKDTQHNFDEAMTIALYRQLKELGVQSRTVARNASGKVRGKWYTGNFIPNTKMRNFDIGLDGFVTPTLVPDVNVCDAEPLTLPVPTLDILKHCGFSMTYRIKPNVLEQGRIYKAAGSKKIYPETHFPVILDYMKNQARKKGYLYDE